MIPTIDPPGAPSCATCAYYGARVFPESREGLPPDAPTVVHDPGECRRYPPELVPPYGRARFPPTIPDQWCGEYQPRGTVNVGLPPVAMS